RFEEPPAEGSRSDPEEGPRSDPGKGPRSDPGKGPRSDPDGRVRLRVYATIVVDRESQKPIVIGRGGEMIKRIGTAGAADLERFFQTRVYLDLQVRVKSEWREDDRVLQQLGLGPK